MKIKKFLLAAILMLGMSTDLVKAEGINVNYSQSSAAIGGSGTVASDYCSIIGGCRSLSVAKLQITIKYRNSSHQKSVKPDTSTSGVNTTVSLPYKINSAGAITTKGYAVSIKDDGSDSSGGGYKRIADEGLASSYFSEVNKQMNILKKNTELTPYDNVSAFYTDLNYNAKAFYALLVYLEPDKYTFDKTMLSNTDKKYMVSGKTNKELCEGNTKEEIGNCKINKNGVTFKQFVDNINSAYIIFEPITTITIPKDNFVYETYLEEKPTSFMAIIGKKYINKVKEIGDFASLDDFLYTGVISARSGTNGIIYTYGYECDKYSGYQTREEVVIRPSSSRQLCASKNASDNKKIYYDHEKFTKARTAWLFLKGWDSSHSNECANNMYEWSKNNRTEAQTVLTRWRRLLSLISNTESKTGTIKELATWLTSNADIAKRAGIDYSTGKMLQDSVSEGRLFNLVGSVASHIDDLSMYMSSPYNMVCDRSEKNGSNCKYSKVTSAATSFNEVKNEFSGYGLGIMDPYLDYDSGFGKEACDFDEKTGKIIYPKIPGLNIERDYPDFCCSTTYVINGETYRPWGEGYSQTNKPSKLQKFEKTDLYKKLCPVEEYCGETQFNKIQDGEALSTPIGVIINGKGDQTLEACCYLDAYKKPDGTYSISNDKIQKFTDINGKQMLPACNYTGCTYNEYKAIKQSGENKSPDQLYAPILDQDLPFLINGKQYTYDYCCAPGGDAEAGFNHYDLVNNKISTGSGSIKFTKFKTELVNLYCVRDNNPCSTSDMERLISLNNLYKTNGTTIEAINNEKVVINGQQQSILTCCYKENYGDKKQQDAANKYSSSKLTPPNFDNSGVLIKADAICPKETDYCTYSNSLAKGLTKLTINGKSRNCCSWEDFGENDDESKLNTGFNSKEEFEKDSKYKELCSKKCTWSGKNTEAIQYVDGEKVNCCEYNNFDNPSKETLAKYKDSDNGVNGVKSQADLMKTGWYKNQPACNSTQACTINKMFSDENEYKRCCDDISLKNFTLQTDKDAIALSGGLTNYLINRNYEKYFNLCDANVVPCSYFVTGECPNCDSDSHNSGKTADIVNGVDSTDLLIPEHALKCIVDNDTGGYGFDSYLYEELGSEYCPVLCTQEVIYDYPRKSSLSVQGGRYIPTSVINPKIHTVLTCRIKEVDISEFEADLKDAISKLEKAYDEYSNAKVPIVDSELITTYKSDDTCDCRNFEYIGQNNTKEDCCKDKGTIELKKEQMNITYNYYDESYAAKEVQGEYSQYECPSGHWISTKTEYEWGNPTIKCNDCQSSCKTTTSEKCSYSKSCTCSDGKHNEQAYELVGQTCKLKTSWINNRDCTRSGSQYKCAYYNCLGKIETKDSSLSKYAYLKTSSNLGETKNPYCQYEYCIKNYERYDAQTVKGYDYSFSYETDEQKGQNARDKKTCENTDEYYSKAFEKTEKEKYEGVKKAIENYNNTIDKLKKCFSVNEDMLELTNYNVNINLEYKNGEDGIPYQINTDLVPSTTVNTTDDFERTSYTVKGVNIPLDWFNGNPMTTKAEVIENAFPYTTRYKNGKTIKKVEKIYSARIARDYAFTLPEEKVYRLVSKNSFSVLDTAQDKLNSVDIGAHLPVAFNNKDKVVVVELKTTFEGGIIKPTFDEKICKDEYVCKNGIIKPCVEPVYRPISLTNPFPDEDGDGRKTGTNWCDGTDCSNTNEVVKDVILNNRGVTSNQVYNLTPLYTIELTPSRIKEIRDYNKATTYGDYNLICDGTTGRRCRSIYLRGEVGLDGKTYITNNLTSIGAVKAEKSCALTKNLAGCAQGDFYEEEG